MTRREGLIECPAPLTGVKRKNSRRLTQIGQTRLAPLAKSARANPLLRRRNARRYAKARSRLAGLQDIGKKARIAIRRFYEQLRATLVARLAFQVFQAPLPLRAVNGQVAVEGKALPVEA